MHPFENLQIQPGSVGIHWFGQSSYALKDAAGTIVQIDPYFPRVRPAERYLHAEPPLDEADLDTDYVLLTHNHSDHTCIESLQRIHAAFPHVRFIAPAESAAAMMAEGIPGEVIVTIRAGDSITLGAIGVHAVWAKPPEGFPEHGIKPPDVDHLGYVIVMDDVRIYVSGDPVNTFAEHRELLDPIIKLKPDIGFLTTHPTEGEFPFFASSVDIARKLHLKTAVPAHYACFTKRNYDPHEWAQLFPAHGPTPLVIPYNSSIVYKPDLNAAG